MVVSTNDNFKALISEQPIRGIVYSRLLTLAVPRWQKQHQPLDLAARYRVKFTAAMQQMRREPAMSRCCPLKVVDESGLDQAPVLWVLRFQ